MLAILEIAISWPMQIWLQEFGLNRIVLYACFFFIGFTEKKTQEQGNDMWLQRICKWKRSPKEMHKQENLLLQMKEN